MNSPTSRITKPPRFIFHLLSRCRRLRVHRIVEKGLLASLNFLLHRLSLLDKYTACEPELTGIMIYFCMIEFMPIKQMTEFLKEHPFYLIEKDK